MIIKLAVFFLLINLSVHQAWAQKDEEKNISIFFRLAELSYMKLELANKLNIVKLYEQEEVKTEKDFQREEENLLCTQISLSHEYIDFVKVSNFELAPSTLNNAKKTLEEYTKKLEKRKIRCNSNSIKESYIDELFAILFNPKLSK